MSALAAEGLAVRLGRRPALAGIDLAFAAGALTVVVGPNGAGKTTLLRALAGLVRPAAGRVTLRGRPLAGLSGRERARLVAYLPQGGSVAWPLPVADVVALGRLPHGERPGALPPDGRAAVAAAIRAVGLDGYRSRPVTELSGGERARVLLARALATEAPVILADEPVASLDPRHQLVVLDVLRGRAAAGAAVVCVMHDLTLAARFADRVVLLDGGRVRAEGEPADVLTPERLAETFGIEARIALVDAEYVIAVQRAVTIDE
ncbi:MAG TPA: ABC transporter ATP-binding protein [Microvirga sp.]|nr:ABC transporter ATP-binding protein [Microvirga sp.]